MFALDDVTPDHCITPFLSSCLPDDASDLRLLKPNNHLNCSADCDEPVGPATGGTQKKIFINQQQETSQLDHQDSTGPSEKLKLKLEHVIRFGPEING